MTVTELMATLAKFPANARVVIPGYEGGYDDLTVEDIVSGRLALNVHTEWYYGPHVRVGDYHHAKRPDAPEEDAVLLSGEER